jgi:hypothetical protein
MIRFDERLHIDGAQEQLVAVNGLEAGLRRSSCEVVKSQNPRARVARETNIGLLHHLWREPAFTLFENGLARCHAGEPLPEKA